MNAFLLQHRVVSWVLWALSLIVFMRPFALVTHPPATARLGLVGWLVIAVILYSAGVAILLERLFKMGASEVISLRCLLANSGILIAFSSWFVGTPQLVAPIATLIAVAVMIFAMLRAKNVIEAGENP